MPGPFRNAANPLSVHNFVMKRFLIVAAAAVAISVHADLGVGDKAPALKVASIVKGAKVDLSKGVHVVEFWATWCGPCKQSIPHLTEMAKKYKGKVDFTGVSVWENGADQIGQVKKFVTEMGNNMNYNVAFDGESKYMANNWMIAAKQDGIPASFIVKDGVVLWIGHPMDGLDETLGKVLGGKYDAGSARKAAKAEADLKAKQRQQQMAMQGKIKPFVDAMQKSDFKAALAALDKLEGDKGLPEGFVKAQKIGVYIKLDDSRANALATELAAGMLKNNAMGLNSVAWDMVDPEQKHKNMDYKVALSLAKRSVELSKGASHESLDTLAVAYFRVGDKAEALATAEKALALAKKQGGAADSVKEYEARIAWIKKG